MKFDPPLQQGTLLRRYKRFLADIRCDTGEITLHCPNTGSMKNCVVPESPCWFSRSTNPKRKYPCTWELATVAQGHLAGINTGRANSLVEEALQAGVISELAGFTSLRREVRYGNENSRIDFLLGYAGEQCYLEVKSVTLAESDGCGYFPDAVSERGRRHLRELMHIAKQGQRAVLLFCVQHTGIDRVRPADHIDPAYGQVLREASQAGVELLAYRAAISPEEIRLCEPLSVELARAEIAASTASLAVPRT